MIIKEEIIEVLKNIEDPELKIDLWTLGLIYGVELDEVEQIAKIIMTFTTPLCPYGPTMVEEIKKKIVELGAKAVEVDVVFTPPWKPSEEVKMMLGLT